MTAWRTQTSPQDQVRVVHVCVLNKVTLKQNCITNYMCVYAMFDVLGCDNVVDLDFVSHNEEARDYLGERESTASNVNYDGAGNAVFSSDSSVVLWQFYQMELDSGFRISVRVKPDAGPGPMRTLLSDDDCSSSERPSVVIGFKTIENNTVHVIFGLSLQNRGAMSFLNITTRV